MKREPYKFLSGACAALGYVHAAYAAATSRGLISEPVFLGRRWRVGYMWAEAAMYTGLAVVLGRKGWGGAPEGPQRQDAQSLAAAPRAV